LMRVVSSDELTYLIDVRSETEYTASHIPGSLSVPGGQAVQRADDFVAVRNGRIVFISNSSTRAVMAAYWYRQMGFPDVRVLEGGVREWGKTGGKLVAGASHVEPLGYEAARKFARLISARNLDQILQSSAPLVLDVGTSIDYETAHVPGARWISRGWIEITLPRQIPDRNRPLILTCPDDRHSVLAARMVGEIGYENVLVLDGGARAWRAAGYQTEQGLVFCLIDPNDVVLSPSIKGDKEAMQRYLDWEEKLAKF
jgi:rhodanese-related sulfurtransferase